jgi:hypothetical protein
VDGECHIFGAGAADYQKKETEILRDGIDHWQRSLLENRTLDSIFLQASRAPVWLLRPRKNSGTSVETKEKKQRHTASLANKKNNHGRPQNGM